MNSRGSSGARKAGGQLTRQEWRRQYLREGLVDELHLAIAPVLLGSGENLFARLYLRALGYPCVERAATDGATHIVLRKDRA